jgi:hypothetical protein
MPQSYSHIALEGDLVQLTLLGITLPITYTGKVEIRALVYDEADGITKFEQFWAASRGKSIDSFVFVSEYGTESDFVE